MKKNVLYVVYKVMDNGKEHEVKRFWNRTSCLNYCLKIGGLKYRTITVQE